MANKQTQGLVVKSVGGIHHVKVASKVYRCQARGILKRNDKIYVGDMVSLQEERGVYYIANVLPRRNLLTRPYVSNVDCLAVVIAPLPVCDWGMVDKMMLASAYHGVDIVLVCNKNDLGLSEYQYALRVYGSMARVYSVSTQTGEGVDELFAALRGVVCLAGQSAVGKSSLMNAFADLGQATGDLSRIKRGRNTTRHIELFSLREDLQVMDTCGFSLLEPEDVSEAELALYYPDFVALGRCKFAMCTHLAEPECVVKQAVQEGVLDRGRYERYVALYNELAQRRKNNYD